MKRSICIAILTLGLTATARGELVSNGGFETGDFTNWLVQAAPAGSDFAVVNNFANTGLHSVLFQGTGPGHDEIAQNLATTNGQQYQISFWLHNLGAGNDSFQVVWENSLVLDLTEIGSELESWQQHIVNVTATSNGSELRLKAYDEISAVYLDDVSVTAVPEPASAMLLAIGVALFARRVRS